MKIHPFLLALLLVAPRVGSSQTNIFESNGNVGVANAAPLDRVHVNAIRPIILGNNGTSGVYGSHIGFNTTINTVAVPNTITKLGSTSQQGGAMITVDHWGNFALQTYNAGTENEATVNYAPQFLFTSSGNFSITSSGGTAGLHINASGNADTPAIIYENSSLTGTRWSTAIGYDNQQLFLGTRLVGSSGYATVLTANGNIGIGTSAPAARLSVVSTGGVSGLHVNASGGADTPAITYENSWFTGTKWLTAIGYDNQKLFLGTRVMGSPGYALALTADGNVGIGTTNATHKLAVNGAVRAKEVIVDTGWADYVFADDYELKPLSEVESFIKQHRRLPEMPSAEEVKERGVSIGEAQSKLLAKVEEVVLHLIRLEKENAKLRKEVDELKASSAR